MKNLTLSITQLNNYIKNIFDNEELLIGVSVYGEVTNFKISNSIAYFDIKEEGAQLSCVKFSCFAPFVKNGDQVIVTGKLNYHVKLGKLSFVAQKVEPYGMGELYKQYLELKARLESQGVFDQIHKKEIPKYCKNIGVVTSETGAVIRDIYHVTKSKNPYTNLLVYPAKVQGVNAELEIEAGIKFFNEQNNVDVIIVARGGGSFEDLAPFNTERVALAAFNSRLPIISAVGHETDFSILDFASDLRAPTPSVAAEVAVFDYYQEMQYLNAFIERISRCVDNNLIEKKQNLVNIDSHLNKSISNKIIVASKDFENLKNQIVLKVKDLINNHKQNLNILTTKLEKSNPLSILKSGYSKVLKDNKSITSVSQVDVGQMLQIYMEDGLIESQVKLVKEKK